MILLHWVADLDAGRKWLKTHSISVRTSFVPSTRETARDGATSGPMSPVREEEDQFIRQHCSAFRIAHRLAHDASERDDAGERVSVLVGGEYLHGHPVQRDTSVKNE